MNRKGEIEKCISKKKERVIEVFSKDERDKMKHYSLSTTQLGKESIQFSSGSRSEIVCDMFFYQIENFIPADSSDNLFVDEQVLMLTHVVQQ